MTNLAILIAIAGNLQAHAAPKSLAFLVGSWRSEEVAIRGENETPFVCHSEGKVALRGMYVQLDERFEIDSMKFENHIMFTDDRGDVTAWWYSSSLRKPMEFVGKAEGQKLILTCQQPPYRLIFEPQNADHFKVRLELKTAGEWKLTTRADYRRVK